MLDHVDVWLLVKHVLELFHGLLNLVDDLLREFGSVFRESLLGVVNEGVSLVLKVNNFSQLLIFLFALLSTAQHLVDLCLGKTT